MTSHAVLQVLLSGVMMGLLYALIAAGLSLIFGLMDVVNFAHGEFLMVAMYAMFALVGITALDPLLLVPVVTALLFVFGCLVFSGIVRIAMRAKTNLGMVQVFATFGLGMLLQGVAQLLFTPDYRSLADSWIGGKTLSVFGLYMPVPQLVGAGVSIAAFAAMWLMIARTDFGKALEATREDSGAVALVGINKDRIFTLGWGVGAALVGLAGSIMAIFFYIHPGVGAPFALIAFVTVALGGFGSIFGALAAGILVGVVEATSALVLSPSMKSLGIYAVYLAVIFIRPRGLFGSL